MKNLQLHQGFLTPLANFHNSLAHGRSILTARRYFVMALLQCRFASATAAIVAWAIYSYWIDTRNTYTSLLTG